MADDELRQMLQIASGTPSPDASGTKGLEASLGFDMEKALARALQLASVLPQGEDGGSVASLPALPDPPAEVPVPHAEAPVPPAEAPVPETGFALPIEASAGEIPQDSQASVPAGPTPHRNVKTATPVSPGTPVDSC